MWVPPTIPYSHPSLLSLPLLVKYNIIEQCYHLNDQRVVIATGSLRASCRSFYHLILSHPLWQHITQFNNCELCEFKKSQSPSFTHSNNSPQTKDNDDIHLGTSSKDPAFLGKLYLHHMGLLKSKNSYRSYLKYYQFEQGVPNIFHIHRVCGDLSEIDTIACLIEQEMQFGDNKDFRVGLLVGIIIYFFSFQ